MLLKNVLIVSASLALLPLAARAADLGAEVANAQMHAGLAAQGADIGTVHTHLHHALNCLVGPAGSGFDSKELNPCASDGNGAIPDETDASKRKVLQSAATTAAAGISATDFATAQHAAAQVASTLKSAK